MCVGGCYVDAYISARVYVCVRACARVRKPIYERVCGIPLAEYIRKVTPKLPVRCRAERRGESVSVRENAGWERGTGLNP